MTQLTKLRFKEWILKGNKPYVRFEYSQMKWWESYTSFAKKRDEFYKRHHTRRVRRGFNNNYKKLPF